MSTFTDCADNLTCATLSGSNGIGVGLVSGTPNKIVVSASNVPNNALANSSININGTTIALGASGSITVGAGTVTSVAAGTNLSASGTATDPVLNLTGNITSGLSSVTGLTNVSSNAVTGTNISATNINTTTLTGSVSGSSGHFTTLTASNILSNTVTGSVSGTSGQFVILTGSNIYSNAVTGSVSGTSGQFGSATINTLTSTNISAATVSGTLSGSGALVTNLTASHINHFQEDVRKQFTAGSGIDILLGQISVTNVPNSSLANTGSVIGSTAVVLGTTVPSLAGLTSVSSTTGSFSILSGTVAITGSILSASVGISGALGQFNTLTASNGKVLTTLSASQVTASSISSSNYVGLTATSPVQYSNNIISLNAAAFTSSVGGAVTVATPLTKSGTTIGIQEASNILVGVVTTGAQTFAGIKTFNSVITASGGITGSSTAQFTTISGSTITGSTISASVGISGTLGLYTNITGTNISGTSALYNRITGSSISSSNYIGLTGSSTNFPNFQSDVRKQISSIGSISYDNSTGIISYTGGGGTIQAGDQYKLAYYPNTSGDTVINDTTNLYHINSRLGVGVSTLTDSFKLQISGTTRLGSGEGGAYIGNANSAFTYGSSQDRNWTLHLHSDKTNGSDLTHGHLVLTAPMLEGPSSIAALYFGINGTTSNNSYSWIQSRLPNTNTNLTRSLSLNPNGGNVGIGTTSPTAKLDVSGSARIVSDLTVSGNVFIQNLTTDADHPAMSWDSATKQVYVRSSDAKLKENIYSLNTSEMLNIANNLNPVKFAWKNRKNSDDTDVGFIAQEVLTVFSYAVGPLNNGYYTFKDHKLIPVAIGAIKELKKENDELKNTLNEVLARLSALENK